MAPTRENHAAPDTALDTAPETAPDMPPETAPGAAEEVALDDMMEKAEAATALLKALAHEGRLMILCHLSGGEKSVTELESLLGSRQAAVSQQLARLRLEGLVENRRDGKTIYYRIGDERVRTMVRMVHDMFCAGAERQPA